MAGSRMVVEPRWLRVDSHCELDVIDVQTEGAATSTNARRTDTAIRIDIRP